MLQTCFRLPFLSLLWKTIYISYGHFEKKIEKEVMRRHTRLRETDDLAIWGAAAIKQQPPISVSSISMKVRLTMLRNHLYICYEVMILLSLQITGQKALPL